MGRYGESSGVTELDIKPHNLVITPSNVPLLMQCRSIVYEHISAICTHFPSHLPIHIRFPRLQLADEEAGSEHAQALGQDVLGEDVDERWQEDESHGGLVDEEERDELGHRRLEHGLFGVSFPPSLQACHWCFTICCDPTSVFLIWLATSAGRAIADGRTAVGARKAALAKGRRKRAFMLGYLVLRVSATAAELAGLQLAKRSLRGGN